MEGTKVIDDPSESIPNASIENNSRTTRFLALSKPGGGRDFLQVCLILNFTIYNESILIMRVDYRYS